MSGQASASETSLVLKRSHSGDDVDGGDESVPATGRGPALERSPSQPEEPTSGKRVQTKGESGKKRRKVNHGSCCIGTTHGHTTADA